MKKHLMMLAAAAMLAPMAIAQTPPVSGPPNPPQTLIDARARQALLELPAKAKLTVTTPAWKEMGDIPFANTQYQGNTFPGLTWTAGPAGTKSYAIIMQDTDGAMRGAPILHWTMFNIPATTTSLPAGMAPEAKPAGSEYGANYQGAAKPYLGPRTPPGPKHAYHMQVFALDTTLTADQGKDYDSMSAAMKGHVLASGEVVGLGQADPNAPQRARPAAPAAAPATPASPTP